MGTNSDVSDFDLEQAGLISECSEDSDGYGIYYGSNSMYDTANDSGNQHDYYRQYHGIVDKQFIQQMQLLNTSQPDSAYSGSGSLFPTHELVSGSTDSSDSCDDVYYDETISISELPLHTHFELQSRLDEDVYGQYQKLPSYQQNENNFVLGQTNKSQQTNNYIDMVMLHRLPGENIGMILGIEDGKNTGNFTRITVKSVTLGGAAYRATGSSKGLCVGDEIVKMNGLDLRTLSHDECIQVFKDMPLRVLLGIKRGQKDLPAVSISQLPPDIDKTQELKSKIKSNKPVSTERIQDTSESDDDGFKGFVVYKVIIKKEPQENLGLSITPSYGSTKEYYQIKRILQSGAAAKSGHLLVGDRLISCNSTSLRALTQSHCLDIIKSLSRLGDVEFEVIRPMFHGSPMEISVTPNNYENTGFDSHQCSLKSQSYDRDNVDIVVTSKSDDYLTVSEDEYSQSGILANIPEVEGNRVFVSNSVRLAFQNTISTIQEETSTETELEIIDADLVNSGCVQVLDLIKAGTAPYHISYDRDTEINHSSFQELSPGNITDIDTLKLLQGYQISVENSNSDTDSDTSSNPSHSKDFSYQTKTEFPFPRTNIDQATSQSPISDIGLDPIDCISNTYLNSGRTSYLKRQQVPSESENYEINLPCNYSQESFEDITSVNVTDDVNEDTNDVRYNPLYDDSSLSEITDSDVPVDKFSSDKDSIVQKGDIYVAEVSKSNVLKESDESGEINETVPPPVEFSDYQKVIEVTKNQEVACIELPVTNFDDLPVLSAESFQQDSSEISSENSLNYFCEVNLESSLHKFEQVTNRKIKDFAHFNTNDDLTFNSELTVPFNIVLQEQGLVKNQPLNSLNFDEINDSDIFQVVTNYNDGTVVISQSEPEETRDLSASSVHYNTKLLIPSDFSESIMDDNSEAMLKEALAMEYENLPEFKKYETRLKLGEHFRADENHLDRENNEIDNVVAEIEQNEHEKYIYCGESDNEPDHFQDQSAPKEVPELPVVPPPPKLCYVNYIPLDHSSNNLVTDGFKEDKTETINVQDKNWIKNSVHIDPNSGHEQVKDENDVHVVPVNTEKNKLKVELDQVRITDAIVAVNSERKRELPSYFSMVELQVDARNDKDIKEVIKKKSPPPVLPKPNKTLIKLDGSLRKTESLSTPEQIVEDITPVKVKQSYGKTIVNLINVVNAVKAGVTHTESKNVEKIETATASNEIKDMFSNTINFSANRHVEISPPKYEQEVVSREKISLPKHVDRELSAPRNEVIEIERAVIGKTKEPLPVKHQSVFEKFPNLKTQLSHDKDMPNTESSIIVEEPQVNILKCASATDEQVESTSVSCAVVSPLNLETITDTNIDTISLQNDYLKERLSPQTYKTTIDIPKQGDIEKPQFALTKPVKFLSQIKCLSFNPKSLPQSGTRPLQYTPLASTIWTKSLLSPVSKSDVGSPNVDQQIKHMESMPFEVSVLKGILGIGIKTSMTPEGYVQVTEVLSNGPVWREGNIKVGDYILSINGTELTGQTDGKVQQILRLLPHGLSKIVASPVPPDHSSDQVLVEKEKAQLKTHQSLSMSSRFAPKQSPVLSQRHPAASTAVHHMTKSAMPLQFKDRPSSLKNIQSSKTSSKSPLESPQSSELSPRSSLSSPQSSLSSPRSPKSLSDSPIPSPRSHFRSEMSQNSKEEQSFNLDTLTSKLLSPRQPGSQLNIYKMPPPVAPKPKKANEKLAEFKSDDYNTPIETEIFVSINASNVESKLAGKGNNNIFPSSITYDTVSSIGNANWTPDMVMLADIKTADAKGNIDAVYAHEEPFDTTDSSKVVLSDTEENNDTNSNMAICNDTLCLEAIESDNKLDVVYSQIDNSLSENKPHTLSTSSSSDNECYVEDIIPENIKDETELKQIHIENLNSELKGANVDMVRARSENVERELELDTNVQFTISSDIDSFKDIAKTIVMHVMESVKGMDLSSHEPNDILPPLPEEIPQPPAEAPPIPINGPPSLDDIALDYDERPPPLPDSEVPTFNPVPADVVDLALYPDTDKNEVDSHEQFSKSKHDEIEIIDVVTKSVGITLHAASPFTDTNFSKNDIYRDESSMAQNTVDSTNQEEEVNIDDTEAGDQSISNVISLYSNIEKSFKSDNLEKDHFLFRNNIDDLKETNIDTAKILTHIDEFESCDTKSLSRSEDFLSGPDIAEKVVVSDNRNGNKLPSCTNYPQPQNISTSMVNGHSAHDTANGHCTDHLQEILHPKTEVKLTSRVDHTDEIDDTKLSKETLKPLPLASVMSEIKGRQLASSEVSKIKGRQLSGSELSDMKNRHMLTVTMNKGVTGLGFVIQGGKCSPKGDQPISIKRIFKGGPAERILQETDEIIEVNDQDMSNMRQNEAWNHLKCLPSGNVVMTIRRHGTQESDIVVFV